MNKKNKANQTAQLALLIATMVVIEVLSQTIFAAFVLPIKPTLTHIRQSEVFLDLVNPNHPMPDIIAPVF